MRQKTYLMIIQALRSGVSSKRGIQDYTGLSWGSCSPVINHLLSQGVIETTDLDQADKPSKGRKTKFYNFSTDRFLLMGMEVDRQDIKCCLATLNNDPIGFFTYRFSAEINASNLVKIISDAFIECCRQHGIGPENINSISFSLPGAIDVHNKIWMYSTRIPEIDSVNFNLLEGNSMLPQNLYIQHDIHAQANSVIPEQELKDGDYVFIHVGDGIGMSANMGGILRGSRGFAGEIGHIPYPQVQKNLLCICGNENCIETILNSDRILAFINGKFSTKVTSLDQVSDPEIMRTTVSEYILPPLVYVSTIISNIFDPRRIIIGGFLLEPFYRYLIGNFENELRQLAWFNGPSEICWYKAEDLNGAYGAILHSGESVMAGLINQIDLDHHG